jgi:hypothetical protein
MAESVIDEFGMNFHPTYLSHLGDGIYVYATFGNSEFTDM